MNWNVNNYLKGLAISHVDLQHTPEKPAFFREYSTSGILFDNSDFLNKMRYANRIALVSQFNEDGGINGVNADSHSAVNTGAIYIISKTIDKDIEQARQKSKEVLIDIISKIIYDSENNIIPSEIQFDIKSIDINTIGMIADTYFGISAFMKYTDFSLCFNYKPDKWI